jgi:2-polyprenyl-6-hydroxyphenyl methylase/3-demethylubiquinone-9 3-methyltransferase
MRGEVSEEKIVEPGRRAMVNGLQRVCPARATCKCCGASAVAYGVVDFHKNCEIYRRKVLDISGIPIYYHRCPACEFIFTTAFDDFSKEDFLRYIYNEEYAVVDPDYPDERPRVNAAFLCNVFSGAKPHRILDYGGGNGVLAEVLRNAGFACAETYDPFVAHYSERPDDRFDCVVSFEVLEHSTQPADTIAEMNDLLMSNGLIMFSTLVQPDDIDSVGLNWWYAGPRNGHVSLFTRNSLAMLAQRFGLTFGSFGDGFHVLFREVPEFARHLIRA